MNGYGYLIVGIVVVAIIALLATNKKFVETLKNIYKIEELRKRILYTLGLLLVYRLGCFVVIPGINPNALGEGIGYEKTAFAGISIDYRRFMSDSLLENFKM